MKITGAQLRNLVTASRTIMSRYYQGTVGVPSVYFDDRSTKPLKNLGLIDGRMQEWTTPAGEKRIGFFWTITDIGRKVLVEHNAIPTQEKDSGETKSSS